MKLRWWKWWEYLSHPLAHFQATKYVEWDFLLCFILSCKRCGIWVVPPAFSWMQKIKGWYLDITFEPSFSFHRTILVGTIIFLYVLVNYLKILCFFSVVVCVMLFFMVCAFMHFLLIEIDMYWLYCRKFRSLSFGMWISCPHMMRWSILCISLISITFLTLNILHFLYLNSVRQLLQNVVLLLFAISAHQWLWWIMILISFPLFFFLIGNIT